MIQISTQPKPDWAPLPRPGCDNVEFRVLLGSEGIFIANLRFQPSATIDKHSAPFDIDVICLSGDGFTSIGNEIAPLTAGQVVRWPKGEDHCLWTTDHDMETIMVERHSEK